MMGRGSPQATAKRLGLARPAGARVRRARQPTLAFDALGEASTIFTAIGAGAWRALADAETARLGRRRARDDSLTPTEEEVVRLAAGGSTNSQMATAMHVSPKTIEAHLIRIYRKLGIRSRPSRARSSAPADCRPQWMPEA
jgi:DNA-binding CsgD family transcriptional regulator